MKRNKANKALDKEIDRIYREDCSGIQISMMDVPKVFEVGYKAHADGVDMKEAIVKYVQSIRKN